MENIDLESIREAFLPRTQFEEDVCAYYLVRSLIWREDDKLLKKFVRCVNRYVRAKEYDRLYYLDRVCGVLSDPDEHGLPNPMTNNVRESIRENLDLLVDWYEE